MRQIGKLNDKENAVLFCDYLYGLGIESEAEEMNGEFLLWVHDDEQVAQAAEEFRGFQGNPSDPRFSQRATQGRERWKHQKKAMKKSRNKAVDVRTTWGMGKANAGDMGFLTIGLTVVSVGVFAIGMFVQQIPIYEIFSISLVRSGFLPEVFSGQIWRLITPIFLHFGILHIIFNLMWLNELGGLIERVHGTLFFTAMVLLFALPSNLGQYLIVGPNFGGMSGVVYGLFGFVWYRSKFDRNVEYALPQHIVVMMIAWFFLCWTGLFGPIANWAHAIGLVVGMGAGYITALNHRN